jgi:hypothetical protein
MNVFLMAMARLTDRSQVEGRCKQDSQITFSRTAEEQNEEAKVAGYNPPPGVRASLSGVYHFNLMRGALENSS